MRHWLVMQGCMGQVEVEDQVLGLQTAAQCVDFLDLQRVGVMGWSYGGYMALMAIAKFPSIFKVWQNWEGKVKGQSWLEMLLVMKRVPRLLGR